MDREDWFAVWCFGLPVLILCGLLVWNVVCFVTEDDPLLQNHSSTKNKSERPWKNGYVSAVGIDLGEDDRMKDREMEIRNLIKQTKDNLEHLERLIIDSKLYDGNHPVGLKLKSGYYHHLTKQHVAELMVLHPNIDVELELQQMAQWCEANERKRKTERGIKRFVHNWLHSCSSKANQQQHNRLGFLDE